MAQRHRLLRWWSVVAATFRLFSADPSTVAAFNRQSIFNRRLSNATSTEVAVPKTVTVAFAADSRYLPKLLAVVEKLRAMRMGKTYRLIAYNLGGITKEEVDMMRCASPVLLDELRNFDFGAFPPHVRDLKCYAWKPLLLEALHREFPNEGLVWLDSGLILNSMGPWKGSAPDPGGFMERAIAAAQAQGGVVSDKTGGTFEQWVHPKALDYFETQLGFKRDTFMGAHVEPVNNCNGAFSAWAPRASAGPAATADEASLLEASRGSSDGSRTSSSGSKFGEAHSNFPYEARGTLAMARWAACAKVQACMCPAGSNRGNHRQDQAALTMTLATLGLRCYDSTTTGPHLNGTRWVAAHGLRMNRVACQDAECFVHAHAPRCTAS